MTTSDAPPEEEQSDSVVTPEEAGGAEEETAKQPLQLEIDVKEPSVCERRVIVKISREDIDRYLDNAFKEIVPTAEIRGFRIGKAPAALVRKQYKDTVSDRVKGELLMDCMTQVSDDLKFSAISEPDFDFEAVSIPDEGPMPFEFTVEVRPEFDLPEYKGLTLEKPTRDFTEDDIDKHLVSALAQFSTIEDKDGPVALGDYIACNVQFRLDGKLISELKDEAIAVREQLDFPDAELATFGELMTGAVKGDKRTTEITIGADAVDESLSGKTVEAEFEVLGVETSALPPLDEEFLGTVGFESEESLRTAVREEMERQLAYYQNRQIRQQITEQLIKGADWELPPDILRRQSARELERAVMELRSSGFNDDAIQQHINEIRRNSQQATATALKEHFVLERIAEEEQIEATEAEFEATIAAIAQQQDESPRRVRARIEKRGAMDSIRNQIIEDRVLALIQEGAKFTEVAYSPPANNVSSISSPISGKDDAEIPSAKYDDSSGSESDPSDAS